MHSHIVHQSHPNVLVIGMMVHLNVPHTPANAGILLHLDQLQLLRRIEAVVLLIQDLGQLLALHIGERLELDEFFALLHLIRCMGTGARRLVLVGASAVGCQVSVVHGRDCEEVSGIPIGGGLGLLTNRDRSRRPHVLVTVLVDEILELIGRHLRFVQKDVVMSRTCRTLDSRMRVQVKVILERMGDISLHQSSRMRVHILVSRRASLLGEESNVMTLRAHGHGELDLFHLVSKEVELLYFFD